MKQFPPNPMTNPMMLHTALPTRPLGICGILSANGIAGGRDVPGAQARMLVRSADGIAALGITVDPGRQNAGYVTSAAAENAAIGITLGMFYSPSVLQTQPHRASEAVRLPLGACNGMFITAAYTGEALTIVTDPFGTYPVYYRRVGGGLVFSSALTDVLRHPGADTPLHRPQGLAQWVCLEKILDGGTVWESVDKFESASVYRFGCNGTFLERTRYWQPAFGNDTGAATLGNAVDAFASAIHGILGQAQGNAAAALTGGMDSRLVWSVLSQAPASVTAVTHYMNKGTDYRIARQLGKRLGVRHEICHIGEDFAAEFAPAFDALLQCTNGTGSADNAHQFRIYDYHRPWTDTLIDGINANLERNTAMRKAIPRDASAEETTLRTFRWLLHDGVYALLDDDAQRAFERACIEAIASGYERCPRTITAKEQADAFYIGVVQPNYHNDLTLMQQHFNQFITPYFELDYVTALLQVDERLRSGYAFQRAVHRRFAPWMQRMPRSHGEVRTLPVAHPALQLAPLAWDRYVAAKLARVAPKSWRTHLRLTKPSMSFDRIFRGYLETHRDAIIRGLPDGFDRKRTTRYLDGYLVGAHSDSGVMGRLLTLCSPLSVLKRQRR